MLVETQFSSTLVEDAVFFPRTDFCSFVKDELVADAWNDFWYFYSAPGSMCLFFLKSLQVYFDYDYPTVCCEIWYCDVSSFIVVV